MHELGKIVFKLVLDIDGLKDELFLNNCKPKAAI